eukprot:277295-Chlamydomonas_euryale.AAC.1
MQSSREVRGWVAMLQLRHGARAICSPAGRSECAAQRRCCAPWHLVQTKTPRLSRSLKPPSINPPICSPIHPDPNRILKDLRVISKARPSSHPTRARRERLVQAAGSYELARR